MILVAGVGGKVPLWANFFVNQMSAFSVLWKICLIVLVALIVWEFLAFLGRKNKKSFPYDNTASSHSKEALLQKVSNDKTADDKISQDGEDLWKTVLQSSLQETSKQLMEVQANTHKEKREEIQVTPKLNRLDFPLENLKIQPVINIEPLETRQHHLLDSNMLSSNAKTQEDNIASNNSKEKESIAMEKEGIVLEKESSILEKESSVLEKGNIIKEGDDPWKKLMQDSVKQTSQLREIPLSLELEHLTHASQKESDLLKEKTKETSTELES